MGSFPSVRWPPSRSTRLLLSQLGDHEQSHLSLIDPLRLLGHSELGQYFLHPLHDHGKVWEWRSRCSQSNNLYIHESPLGVDKAIETGCPFRQVVGGIYSVTEDYAE